MKKLHLIKFSEIAQLYLNDRGYEPFECESEDEVRSEAAKLIKNKNGHVSSSKAILLAKKILRNSLLKEKI